MIEYAKRSVSQRELQKRIDKHEFIELTDYSSNGGSMPSLFEIASLILDQDDAIKFLVSTEVLKPDSCCQSCGGKF